MRSSMAGALALFVGACAGVAAPDASPSTPKPVAQRPSADAGAQSSDAAATDASPSLAYTRDVWVVVTPPLPVFLLATFTEPAGPSCETRLLAHARSLGANRLYIDLDVPCGGSAFFERPARQGTEGSVTLRGNVRPSDTALGDWMRARWTRPASVSEADARRLCVVVQFTVSPMRRVLDVRGQPIRASGNVDFDESVKAALASAITERANVPVPPRDLVGEIVTYRLEFTLGDPRTCRLP